MSSVVTETIVQTNSEVASTGSQPSIAKKSERTLLVDKSSVERNVFHYVAIFLWIGWTSFYFAFLVLLPFLYLYAKGVLAVLVGMMVISAILPIKRKLQPKVNMLRYSSESL
jgi:membrane-associated protease RseP (regulator of RpoE activity)